MSTSPLAEIAPNYPDILSNICPFATATQQAAMREKAGKACLRAIYGFQPPRGDEYGVVVSAKAHGSIVATEIRFYTGITKPRKGMFELPFHVFKKDGLPLISTSEIQDFVGRVVLVTISDRYRFNGIALSNVAEVDLDWNIVHGTYEFPSFQLAPLST